MSMEPKQIDLAVSWTWEHDSEFVGLIKNSAESARIGFLEITRANVQQIIRQLENREIVIRTYLDRASDEDPQFLGLLQPNCCEGRGLPALNPPSLVASASDKATMHLEFLSAGIEVPHSLLISPYNLAQEIQISISDLSKLGRSFIIKPANTTGGGIGVVIGAETLKQVFDARQGHPNDKFLVQETIRPATISGKRGWFRVFYVCGEVFPCWWDDQTHIYEAFSPETGLRVYFDELVHITQKISTVCGLNFFSTELVITESGKCVAVDYVNEICDMRLKSKHHDGVVDEIVHLIAQQIISCAGTNRLSY